MTFLCPRHRRMFAKLSLNEQNDCWLFWMEHAFTFCESQDTRKLIAATGSAFDLARLARARHPDSMQVELTLSAILVCRALQNQGEHQAAQCVLASALESLRADGPCHQKHGGYSTDDCIKVLLDHSRQREFCSEYLNWPDMPALRPTANTAMAVH